MNLTERWDPGKEASPTKMAGLPSHKHSLSHQLHSLSMRTGKDVICLENATIMVGPGAPVENSQTLILT